MIPRNDYTSFRCNPFNYKGEKYIEHKKKNNLFFSNSLQNVLLFIAVCIGIVRRSDALQRKVKG